MVARHAFCTDKKATATHQPFVAVCPDAKRLCRLTALKFEEQVLDDQSTLRSGVQQSTEKDFRGDLCMFSAGFAREANNGRPGHPHSSFAEQSKPGCSTRNKERHTRNDETDGIGHCPLSSSNM